MIKHNCTVKLFTFLVDFGTTTFTYTWKHAGKSTNVVQIAQIVQVDYDLTMSVLVLRVQNEKYCTVELLIMSLKCQMHMKCRLCNNKAIKK